MANVSRPLGTSTRWDFDHQYETEREKDFQAGVCIDRNLFSFWPKSVACNFRSDLPKRFTGCDI